MKRSAIEAPGYNWIIVSREPCGKTVTCRAPSDVGALRTVEPEYPDVQWADVYRRECACHDRIDCGYSYDICTACKRPARCMEMGMFPAADGMGPLVCGPCYRFSLGLTA